MTIEIRRVQTLSEDEQKELEGWNDLFPGHELNLHYRKPDWNVVLYRDGRLMSRTAVSEVVVRVGVRFIGINRLRPHGFARRMFRLINRNAHSVLVGGVGGMITRPSEQGQWYAVRVGNYLRRYFKDEMGADFTVFFTAGPIAALGRWYGGKLIEDPVYFDQPSGFVRSPLKVGAIPWKGQDWPPGIVDIGGLPW